MRADVDRPPSSDHRTVLFVCPHGAAKSRMAAAFFNANPPQGWAATSAGTEPQAEVSAHAIRLLSRTPEEPWLDRSAPRPVSAVNVPSVLVAVDCAADELSGAMRWELDHGGFDEAMRDEIHARVTSLTRGLGTGDEIVETDG